MYKPGGFIDQLDHPQGHNSAKSLGSTVDLNAKIETGAQRDTSLNKSSPKGCLAQNKLSIKLNTRSLHAYM